MRYTRIATSLESEFHEVSEEAQCCEEDDGSDESVDNNTFPFFCAFLISSGSDIVVGSPDEHKYRHWRCKKECKSEDFIGNIWYSIHKVSIRNEI